MRHLVSFLKSPIGYMSNLFATLWCYVPGSDSKYMAGVDYPICFMCETFCLKDGIQDDMLF